jgi:hypothetical protein
MLVGGGAPGIQRERNLAHTFFESAIASAVLKMVSTIHTYSVNSALS